MKNMYLEDDSVLIFKNSTAAKSSGQAVFQGGMLGILVTDITTATGTGPMRVRGVVTYTKLAGTAWAEGDVVFFDVVNNRMTTTNTTDCVPAGVAYDAAASAATIGHVVLNTPKVCAVATDAPTTIAAMKAAGQMKPA
jgi:predicted RecA/RadA family phage recombinase